MVCKKMWSVSASPALLMFHQLSISPQVTKSGQWITSLLLVVVLCFLFVQLLLFLNCLRPIWFCLGSWWWRCPSLSSLLFSLLHPSWCQLSPSLQFSPKHQLLIHVWLPPSLFMLCLPRRKVCFSSSLGAKRRWSLWWSCQGWRWPSDGQSDQQKTSRRLKWNPSLLFT